MAWKKRGLVYVPSGGLSWAREYATIPTPYVHENGVRIYYAAVDEQRLGRIGFVDLDPADLTQVIHESQEPALDIGLPGSFDDSGVNPSCVITQNDRVLLYYIGWQRTEQVPYQIYTGLAESTDGLQFSRVSAAPILDRTHDEPFLRSAISVLEEGGGYRAWYVSAVKWIEWQGKPYPSYVIRHARSSDGVTWKSDLTPCINFVTEDEFGFGRPWVKRTSSGYEMWYSIRSLSQPYRMGYAVSKDGLNWERKDSEMDHFTQSDSGWDSEMVCYGTPIDIAGVHYMFYNGNQHGRSGFGLAEWVND